MGRSIPDIQSRLHDPLFRHESPAGLRFQQQNFDVPNQKQQICRHQRAVKTRFAL
jgi:hypothetical protein